jgi:hypothetical protein
MKIQKNLARKVHIPLMSAHDVPLCQQESKWQKRW